jgi:hypothetical protein
MRFYNDTGILTGEMVDGKFIPVSPAPEGEAFDDLKDECLKAIGLSPRLKGKTDFNPSVDRASGAIITHSWRLSDEVSRWIKEGDLRSHTQVNKAITTFADHWERLVRLGVVPTWKLELGNLTYLGWFFGVKGAKPLPTKQEFLDEQARWAAREAERIRQSESARRKDKAEMDEWEAKQAKMARIKALVIKISNKLYSFDRIDIVADPLPREYHILDRKRRTFIHGFEKINGYSANELIVEELVERGMIDNEIVEDRIMDTLNHLKEVGQSQIPPLAEGETRRFFTYDELFHFIKGGEWEALLDTHDTVLMLGTDGLWVLDTKSISEKADTGVVEAERR